MNLKICFVGDVHLRATRPVSRLDGDYLGTILDKINRIRILSEEANCDLVILAGDVVDRPDCPHSVVMKAIREFRKFKKPLYTIIGNHDVAGFNGSTLNTSALGTMLESGAIKRLDTLEINGVSIYALHAFDKTDWTVPESDGPRVLVAHKMLLPMAIPGADCILIDDVAKTTNADIILSGDIHTNHLVQSNGKLFVNPGSLSRMSINDRDRLPQVAIVTVADNPEDNDVEMHALTSKPSDMVFDLKNYSHRMISEAHTKDFVKSYAHVVISVKAETGKLGPALAEFMEKINLDDKSQECILSYYDRAEADVLKEIRD